MHSLKLHVYYDAIFFNIIVISINLLSRINVMLGVICIGSIELQETRGRRKNAKWKIPIKSGIQTHNLVIHNQTRLLLFNLE